MLQKVVKHIFDVVVAADGTGNFTKAMDVVNAAPKSNIKRYCHTRKKGASTRKSEIATVPCPA
ncbi:hypothetical protein TSUD_374430 [Trifolium subterraneum]|uniref:Pectinesterase n=1 Tax=Trifolium subterraneum TaxID=3900 RepID=A0A2Z6PFY8_TRISU|nr:hypothetical protein TSUD_374430 [Trifolium subterraneum]